MTRTAFITGITGQDGSYLAELLLKKGYQVVGLVSKEHGIGSKNISHLKSKLILEPGDLLDKNSLETILEKHQPQEIYNLAAISFVPASWEKPSLALNINALGLARILELVKSTLPKTRVYQASSAKMFGQPEKSLVSEADRFKPTDPYGVSKTTAHFLAQNFRNKYGLFVSCGIMFNHESPRRGPEFVTRKITQSAAKIKLGLQQRLFLGNLEAQADWGWAPDYVEAMWLMLQHQKADDFILATGQLHSVKEVCQVAFTTLGLDYQEYVKKDPKFTRKSDKKPFAGDASKAKDQLNWSPGTNFKNMIKKMVDYDLQLIKEKK